MAVSCLLGNPAGMLRYWLTRCLVVGVEHHTERTTGDPQDSAVLGAVLRGLEGCGWPWWWCRQPQIPAAAERSCCSVGDPGARPGVLV